ncbi:MAG: ABC transporter permease [Eubacterium sp.]|nr:ABC transporter permease [Eubacterium sp.]
MFFGIKRLLLFLLSIFCLTTAAFYISRLAPGDPLVSYYGERVERMSSQERAQAEERLGLHDPVSVQYIRWLERAVQGDFGISYKYKMDVLALIRGRAGNTLLLGGIGFLLIFTLALLLGILCAWKEESFLDRAICKIGTVSSCIPEYWLSIVLILLFAVHFRWLPSSGAYTAGKEHDPIDRMRHLILPLSVVVFGHLWYYAYLIRTRIREELRAGYVLFAKAKGLSNRSILIRHCLRNALPAYFSLMAISVPHILGGTYMIEMVFSYPGLGTLAYESARYQDYHVLMLLCVLSGVLVILCSMAAQAINEKLDPRIRQENG